jgi:hypothetical protein
LFSKTNLDTNTITTDNTTKTIADKIVQSRAAHFVCFFTIATIPSIKAKIKQSTPKNAHITVKHKTIQTSINTKLAIAKPLSACHCNSVIIISNKNKSE